mmetsp:Transcript_45280/g.104677  ORF Transcript_45280/g.104677 Transcript_45280/m.104677 type:complete len:396 (+) Transcript_45280:64-1251(+)
MGCPRELPWPSCSSGSSGSSASRCWKPGCSASRSTRIWLAREANANSEQGFRVASRMRPWTMFELSLVVTVLVASIACAWSAAFARPCATIAGFTARTVAQPRAPAARHRTLFSSRTGAMQGGLVSADGLGALWASSAEGPEHLGSTGAVRDDAVAQTLRERIAEVKRADRSRSTARWLHRRVLHEFDRLNLTLVPPLRGHTNVILDHVDLRTLATGFYSVDVIELVREHALSTIRSWDHLVREYPLQLALYQVGCAYSTSILFGYALHRAATRYRLDQLLGGPAVAGTTLKDYVDGFGSVEIQQAVSVASEEGHAVLDGRVSWLFGNLGRLQDELERALEPDASPVSVEAQLVQAIEHGQVVASLPLPLTPLASQEQPLRESWPRGAVCEAFGG